MAARETITLAITGVFGVISSVGVAYQAIDIRRRSKTKAHPAFPISEVFASSRSVPLVGVPKVITRARVLILLVTALTGVESTLMAYVSLLEMGGVSGIGYARRDLVLLLIIAVAIAVPLALTLTVLSVHIGGGRSWARVVAIVLLACHALVCPCCGLVYVTEPLNTDTSANTIRPGAETMAMGVVWLALGVVSAAAAAHLLSDDNGHFGRRQIRTARSDQL